jgi:dTDP-glucose 4,6-dehydratase
MMMMTPSPLSKVRPPLDPDDLDMIKSQLGDSVELLRNARIFLTGGTGFFGRWLVESFNYINSKNQLNACLTILSRNPSAFLELAPHLKTDSIEFLKGDVRNFEFPTEKFSHIIHAATEASNHLNNDQPLTMFDVIVQGTRHVLDFAVQNGVKRMLFVSSGAVYGPQPPEVSHIHEDQYFGFAPNDPKVAYAEGKRAAEFLCSVYAQQHGIEIPIARCFAFVGQHLPLDDRFAIGSFINNGINNKQIMISGNPNTKISYLHASDLCGWLYKILIHGISLEPYNVGSDCELSLYDLAITISSLLKCQITLPKKNSTIPDSYVPYVSKTQQEFCLKKSVDLTNAIEKTVRWHQSNQC